MTAVGAGKGVTEFEGLEDKEDIFVPFVATTVNV